MKSNNRYGFFRKELQAFAVLFLCCVLSFVLLLIFNNVIYDIYERLAKAFPESVPYYNSVLEQKEYLRVADLIYAISAIPSVLTAAYISVVFNSSKKHLFFLRTQGFVRFREGCRFYLKNYLLVDIIAAILISVAMSFSALGVYNAYVVKGSNGGLLGFFVLPWTALYEEFGMVATALISAAAILAGSLLAVPHAVLRYRGDALAHSLE